MTNHTNTVMKAEKSKSLVGSAAILFISANIANGANLLFNMLFARFMEPAAFADLTLLLTLKLGLLSFLGAIQFAFSEFTATHKNATEAKVKANALSWQSLKISLPAMFLVFAFYNSIASILNFSSPQALCILAAAIPFFLPLIIYRGLIQGLIDLPKITLSIQIEWIIRLIGSLLLWKMGFGFAGIAIALTLSIIAGLVFSIDKNDLPGYPFSTKPDMRADIKTLGITAFPYLIIQIAQILALDSDILIAKSIFSAETAGLVAGLLLIQRVFFFAFLSCSTLLQPFIVRQNNGQKGVLKDGQKTKKELLLLIMIITMITALALMIIVPNGELIVSFMLGAQYKDLSSIIWVSALTGAVFMVSHLCAIYQIASGKTIAAKIVLLFSLAQILFLLCGNQLFPDIGLYSYFFIKLSIQSACAVFLLGITIFPKSKKALS